MKFLFENFDILAQAPGGVKKLREMILQFAVQGKLVKQDPNDEPASVLLEKIKAEKERLVMEGKIKEQKPLEPIRDDEIPFDLPKGWEFSLFPNVVTTDKYSIKRGPFGSSIKKAYFLPEGYKVYEQRNAIYDNFSLGEYFINEDKFKELKAFEVKPNDIIISCSGTVGKVAIAPEGMQKGIINQALLKITLNQNILTNEYFKILFPAYFMNTDTLSKLKGTAQKNIVSVETLKNLPFPLPPLTEQKRIVAKVDTLMALCDDLEKQQQEKAEKKLTLNKASLHALNNSNTKQDFNKNWDHIINNFNLLYRTSENVNDLKQTILQLAVQGKIVPQDPNDEPASVLLEKIKAEKERLVKEGKIKKQKPLEPSRGDEILFELPKGWEVTKIGAICNINMGQSPPGNTYNNQKMGIPLINGPVEFTPGPFGKTIRRQYTTKPTKQCSKGDFLLCVRGSTTGRTNIADFDACIGRGVAALHSFIHSDFFNWYMVSIREKLYNSGTGSTFKNISYEIIAKTTFVLPPLAEQKRIVAKVDSLMALCDKLSKSFTDKETKSEKMLNAVINQL